MDHPPTSSSRHAQPPVRIHPSSSSSSVGLPTTVVALFPELSKQEILELLEEMGVPLDVEVLNEPHRFKERVKSLFTTLVSKAYLKDDLDPNYFTTIPMEAIVKRQEWYYCEVKDEIYLLLKLFMTCKQFLTVCGVVDFSLRDLFSPSHKRFKHHLSAMINFFKFKETKYGSFDHNMVYHQEELFQELQELIQEIGTLTLVYTQARQEVTEKQITRQNMEEQIQSLQQETSVKNKVQASMRQESILLKKKLNSYKDEIALLDLKIQQGQGDEKKLEKLKVSCPEILQSKYTTIQQTLQQEQQEVIQLESDTQTSKRYNLKLSQWIQDGKNVSTLTSSVLEDQMKYKHIIQEIQQIQVDFEKKDKTCCQLQQEVKVLQEEQSIVENKVNQNRKQYKMKMDSLQHSMDAANKELFLVEKDRRDGMNRMEAMKLEVSTLEAMIQEQEERNNEEIVEILKSFHTLETTVIQQDTLFLSSLSMK